jgi:FKBP-type peptidyl-prolyl cis-trans isomerase 2
MRGLEGLGIGDHTRLELAPEEAFGPIDQGAFQEIAKEMVPSSALRIGFTGELPGPGTSLIPFRIHAIQTDTVTIDLNHPLAGKQVIFDVTIRHVQD